MGLFYNYRPIVNWIRRIWVDRMDMQNLEEISEEIQTLHKPIKNVIEIVFATSPLLALSTSGWANKSFNSTYLLRVSDI